MSNVFTSCAKKDAASARILSDALQRAGFSVWWDGHIPPGRTWDEVIGDSLYRFGSRSIVENLGRLPFDFGRIEGSNLIT